MKNRKLTALITSTLMVTAGLTGCSTILNPTGSGSITIYSNSVSDGRGDWLQEQAKEAGFELNLVDIGGGDVFSRLVAEKENPVADAFFGLNDIFGYNLAKQNILEPYTPAWADEVDTKGAGDGKTYWPIVREPIMLVCNADAYSANDMPKDWPDLWRKPTFNHRYEFSAGLGGATTQMVLTGILNRFPDPKGKLGISDQGWEAVKSYYEHGSRSVDGTDLYARIAQGEVDCGQMWLAGKVTREQQFGVKTIAISPEIGVPMVHQFTGVVKGSKNTERAKAFVDWFGSAEMQSKWSKKFATAPMNKNTEGNPEVIAFTDSFKAQEIDWAFVGDNLAQWIEEINLNYMK
ncbi:extracellular solute-binding protein [Trueperella pyogenes]|uniref:extracellular solute-binding protein n=1 Tax=Trueperella pyogenes TaxID=1661 RepID=UPI00345D2E2D